MKFLAMTSRDFFKFLDKQQYCTGSVAAKKASFIIRRQVEVYYAKKAVDMYYMLKATVIKPALYFRQQNNASNTSNTVNSLGLITAVSNRQKLDDQLYQKQKRQSIDLLQSLCAPEKSSRQEDIKIVNLDRPSVSLIKKISAIKKMINYQSFNSLCALEEENTRELSKCSVSAFDTSIKVVKRRLLRKPHALNAKPRTIDSILNPNRNKSKIRPPSVDIQKAPIYELINNTEKSEVSQYKTTEDNRRENKVKSSIKRDFKVQYRLRPVSAMPEAKLTAAAKDLEKQSQDVYRHFPRESVSHLTASQARVLHYSMSNDLNKLRDTLNTMDYREIDFSAGHLQTPLYYAVRHGNVAMIAELVDHGVNPNRQLKNGDICLHHACKSGRKDVGWPVYRRSWRC
jgi:Ankyrin repeats (many copies)